jgi:hypothetical protein
MKPRGTKFFECYSHRIRASDESDHLSLHCSHPVSVTKYADLTCCFCLTDLCAGYRKDKSLRDFMKSNSSAGLPYTAKQTSIEILEGHKLVYFSKRVYIPSKLRASTMKFYVATYGRDQAVSNLSKYCIWPGMESDCEAYIKENR